jgi:hypothetical protein
MRTKKNSGFALFAVIILLALITAAVALSLDEAVASIQAAGRVRVAEMIKGGLDHGLDRAMDWLQAQDSADVAPDPTQPQPNDIFGNPGAAEIDADNDGTPGITQDYPPTGDYANTFRVRVGMRAGQRTRAPEGEDVTKAYGQIVELQLSVDTTGASGGLLPPAEERVSVGVLIPRASAHAQ